MPKPDDPLPSLESLSQRLKEAKSLIDKGKHGDSLASSRSRFAKVAQLAGALTTGAAVGGICGYMIDRWLALSPIGLITGFLLGFAAGLYNLMKEVEKEEREKNKGEKRER